jgi:hypothetical protein
MKKCTNCTRAEQPLDQFIGNRGQTCSTCKSCRDKCNRNLNPNKPKPSKEKQNEYCRASRARKAAGEIPKEHDMNQECKWAKSEETKQRISHWKKLNPFERLGHSKRSAAKRDHKWSITDDHAIQMMKTPCNYCGHLDLKVRLNGIDRVDNLKGYEENNVVPCCKDCNYAKRDLTVKQFIDMCKKIVEHQKTNFA